MRHRPKFDHLTCRGNRLIDAEVIASKVRQHQAEHGTTLAEFIAALEAKITDYESLQIAISLAKTMWPQAALAALDSLLAAGAHDAVPGLCMGCGKQTTNLHTHTCNGIAPIAANNTQNTASDGGMEGDAEAARLGASSGRKGSRSPSPVLNLTCSPQHDMQLNGIPIRAVFDSDIDRLKALGDRVNETEDGSKP